MSVEGFVVVVNDGGYGGILRFDLSIPTNTTACLLRNIDVFVLRKKEASRNDGEMLGLGGIPVTPEDS